MAVRDEIVASLVEAVAQIQDRIVAGEGTDEDAIKQQAGTLLMNLLVGEMARGAKGDQGPPGADGKDGKDGVDGRDGRNGLDGRDGRPPSPEEIAIAVELWFAVNGEQLRGPAGADGRDGRDGVDGADGRDGTDGRAGRDGRDGLNGVGIADITQSGRSDFTIVLTNGEEYKVKLPVTIAGGGGGGGGIRTITSNDGTVAVTTSGTNVDLSTSGATTNVLAVVRNRTGSTIPKGAAVYISGATGQTSEVSLALATGDATSAQTLGLTAAEIANNATGNVIVLGYLSGVDTSAYTDGQQLYLSPTVPGGMTSVKPYAPNHMVYVAVVEYAHATNGKLFIKVQNGYELDEIHDVLITAKANGDALIYNTSLDVWENKPLAEAVRTASNGATLSGLLAIDANAVDQYNISGLTGPTTLAATTGSPVDGQKLIVRIIGGASPVALTWQTGSAQSWRALGTVLPSATVAGKTFYIGSIYNSAANRWDVVAVAQEA
jgi:hypothetical protein